MSTSNPFTAQTQSEHKGPGGSRSFPSEVWPEVKEEEGGLPWTVVSHTRPKKKAPLVDVVKKKVKPNPEKVAVKKVWKPSAAGRQTIININKERIRSAAFLNSIERNSRVIPPSVSRSVPNSPAAVEPLSPLSAPVTVPSDTAPRRPYRKQPRRPLKVDVSCVPIKQVTKAEAAAPVPVSVRSPSVVSTVSPVESADRGPGFVRVHDNPGTTFVDNNAGRRYTVRLSPHRIRKTKLLAVARTTMSETIFQRILGAVVTTTEEFVVQLPESCVSEFGAWWVARVPSPENYVSYQEYVRRWCQRVDWVHPRDQEDCLMYGAYLGFVTRNEERMQLARRTYGKAFTRAAQCAFAAGASLMTVASLPVAAAASVVVPVPAVATALPILAVTGAVAAAAMAVRWALPWFSHDMPTVQPSLPITSVTCSSESPPQKPDAQFTSGLPPKEHDVIRPAAYPTGTSLAGYEPIVFAPNQDNVLAALRKRSGAQSAPGDQDAFANWVSKHWETVIGKCFDLSIPTDPVEQDEIVADWLKHCHSSPAVKKKVERAWAALRADGRDMHTPLPSDLVFEWTKREASVKVETLLKDDSSSPRQIMAASPEFVALVAPFIKRLTGAIRRKLKSRPLVYAPGMTESDVSALVTERSYSHAGSGDFNAFDSNQRSVLGAAEVKLCRRYGIPVAPRQLLQSNVREVHGHSRQNVKFKMPYCRLSGDPHTTLFNTVWNLFAYMYVMCKKRQCSPLDLDALIIGGGDDTVVLYNGERVDFEAELASIGLPATFKHARELAQLEFLSCRLTRTSAGWRFIPKVGRLFIKFGHSVRADAMNGRGILKGAVNSMRDALQGSPIGRLFVEHWDRLSGNAKEIKAFDEPWTMSRCNTGQPNDETWHDLFVQYGWTRELQAALTRDLATVVDPGCTVVSAALQILVDTDTGRKDFCLPRDADTDADDLKVSSVAPPLVAAHQILVDMPNRPIRALDVPVGCTVGDLHYLVGNGLAVPFASLRVTLDGKDVRDDTILPPDCLVRFLPLLIGGSLQHFTGAVSKLPSVIKTALSGLPSMLVEATTEAAITEAWDQWFVVEEKEVEEKIPPLHICVNLCGVKKTIDVKAGSTYAETLHASHAVPFSVMQNLRPSLGSKPQDWKSLCIGDFEVVAVGRGGSNTNVAAGDRLMDKIAGELGMSAGGKAALTAMIDPMHDTPIVGYCGYPDNDESPSVQQIVQSTYTINAPSGGTNWDCHICNLPWLTTGTGFGFGRSGPFYSTGFYNLTNPTSTANAWCGLMVDAVTAGAATFVESSTTAISLDGASGQVNTQYCLENWRQVATSFEVINSTSELYKQGVVTVYRSPFPGRNSKSTVQYVAFGTSGNGAFAHGAADTLLAQAPPTTPAAALLLQGSKQWEAKEGCYVVSTLNSSDLVVGSDNTAIILEFANSDFAVFGLESKGLGNIPATTGVDFSIYAATGMAVTDFNMAGAYFTGLSNQSTLQVNVMRYFERFPTSTAQSDQPLVVLARPSCRYDPTAMEAYSAVLRHMPVGVPRRFNGIGDWFREAAETVRDVVAPVLSAIPLPLAQAGAGILNNIGKNLVDKYTPKQEAAREIRELKEMVACQGAANSSPGRTFTVDGRETLPLMRGTGGTMVRTTAKPRRKRRSRNKTLNTSSSSKPIVYTYST